MQLNTEPLRVLLADQQRATAAFAEQIHRSLSDMSGETPKAINIDSDLHDYVLACNNTRDARIEAFLAHLVRRFPPGQLPGQLNTAPGNTDDPTTDN